MDYDTNNYLVDHAIKNIYSSPGQDRQFRIRPKRLSKKGGTLVRLELNWLRIYLPDTKNYWYVYMIGQLHPYYLGLFPVQNKWVSLSEVSNQMAMSAYMYNDAGVIIPRFETYYMVNDARNLILAVRERKGLINVNYDDEDLFFRVYTNAFWETQRSHYHQDKIITDGIYINSNQDIADAKAQYDLLKNKPRGSVYALINGYWADDINPGNTKIGYLVEWVYDASIIRVVNFNINSLRDFDSTLDSERKYLLHYNINNSLNQRIHYQDDVELFIYEPKSNPNTSNGIYYHKNTARAMRQITHKDYSISVALVNSLVSKHPNWNVASGKRIRMYIRDAGFKRDLIYENARIHELYKLPSNEIQKILVGDGAVVPVWLAANLENNMYTRIIAAEYKDIDLDKVTKAYGYNAISKLVADTPTKVDIQSGLKGINLSEGFRYMCSFYEYSPQGVLIGYTNQFNPPQRYIANNVNCETVEVLKGIGWNQLEEFVDQAIIPNFKEHLWNFRCYINIWDNNDQRFKWQDVTDSNMYAIDDSTGEFKWIADITTFNKAVVRTDKFYLRQSSPMQSKDGLLEFDLSEKIVVNGKDTWRVLEIPMGELDVFLNGRLLIRGIDYNVHFPRVVIFNKKYRLNDDTGFENVMYRYRGFCKKDLTHERAEDVGYIKYKAISRNNVFNLKDDRVLRIVVDGRLRRQDELEWSEDGTMVTIPNAQNGLPYAVRDIMVPLGNETKFVNKDDYEFREESRIIDKQVSDYLSTKIKDPPTNALNVIPERYPVFSPFLCKIAFDLKWGVIDDSLIVGQHYGQSVIEQLCQPYLYLLKFDPTQVQNKLDPDYVIVHPTHLFTPIERSIWHYDFLTRVITLYMPDSVEQLNHFITIEQ